MTKRILALVLALAVAFSALPVGAAAQCDHHSVHEGCGFVAGTGCDHTCTDACQAGCSHAQGCPQDGSCGYTAGTPCGYDYDSCQQCQPSEDSSCIHGADPELCAQCNGDSGASLADSVAPPTLLMGRESSAISDIRVLQALTTDTIYFQVAFAGATVSIEVYDIANKTTVASSGSLAVTDGYASWSCSGLPVPVASYWIKWSGTTADGTTFNSGDGERILYIKTAPEVVNGTVDDTADTFTFQPASDTYYDYSLDGGVTWTGAPISGILDVGNRNIPAGAILIAEKDRHFLVYFTNGQPFTKDYTKNPTPTISLSVLDAPYNPDSDNITAAVAGDQHVVGFSVGVEGAPRGTVQLCLEDGDGTVLGTGTLESESDLSGPPVSAAYFTHNFPTEGTYTVTARYLESDEYNAAESEPVQVRIAPLSETPLYFWAIPTVGNTVSAFLCHISEDRSPVSGVTRQWYRDDTPIEGATGITYTITEADIGHYLSAKARLSDTVTVESMARYVRPFLPGSFTLEGLTPEGLPVYGEPITVRGSGIPEDAVLHYRWFSTAESVGSDSPTYTPTRDMVSQMLHLRITCENYECLYLETFDAVQKRPLTITPDFDTLTKHYGQQDPRLPYAITAGSLVSGDTLEGSLGRQAGEAPGDYSVTGLGTLGENLQDFYDISLAEKQGAKLTIEKAKPSVSIALSKNSIRPSSEDGSHDSLTITVTAQNSHSGLMESGWAQPANVNVKVAQSGIDRSSNLTLVSSENGVFTYTYSGPTSGSQSLLITAEVPEDEFYQRAVAIGQTVHISDKAPVLLSVAADKTVVTLGQSITLDITVSDPEGGPIPTGTLEYSAYDGDKTVSLAAGKARIVLDHTYLNVTGDRSISLRYSGSEIHAPASGFFRCQILKKPLIWDVSELSASKPAGQAGEVSIFGTLKVAGLVEGCRLDGSIPQTLTTSGFTATEPGTYQVMVSSSELDEYIADVNRSASGSYTLPTTLPPIQATVNQVGTADGPETPDGNVTRLVIEHGISQVPGGLLDHYQTPGQLAAAMDTLARKDLPSAQGAAVYDVKLQYWDGTSWTQADESHWPSSGSLTITLPYPEGTGKDTHHFQAVHMFTSAQFGKTPGSVERPTVTTTANHITFQVTGLSPVAIAWQKVPAFSGTVDVTNNYPAHTTVDGNPATGDAIYLPMLAMAASLTMLAWLLAAQRKRERV